MFRNWNSRLRDLGLFCLTVQQMMFLPSKLKKRTDTVAETLILSFFYSFLYLASSALKS